MMPSTVGYTATRGWQESWFTTIIGQFLPKHQRLGLFRQSVPGTALRVSEGQEGAAARFVILSAMPFDAVMTRAVADDLRAHVLGGRVDKILQSADLTVAILL